MVKTPPKRVPWSWLPSRWFPKSSILVQLPKGTMASANGDFLQVLGPFVKNGLTANRCLPEKNHRNPVCSPHHHGAHVQGAVVLVPLPRRHLLDDGNVTAWLRPRNPAEPPIPLWWTRAVLGFRVGAPRQERFDPNPQDQNPSESSFQTLPGGCPPQAQWPARSCGKRLRGVLAA